MTLEVGLTVFLGLVFAYALVGHRLANGVITAPMAFLAAGWACAHFGMIELAGASHGLILLAEAALVVVLFADAMLIDPRALWRGASTAGRMLVLGLPLMIGFGFIAGLALLPGWPLWEIALLAALLAPTDAALGQSVITNPAIPEPMRRNLAAESGLNDGLALPLVIFFGCFAVGGVHEEIEYAWYVFVGQQVAFGLVAGLCVGAAGGWLLRVALARGLSSEALCGPAVLALAGLSYLLSHVIGGNGFVAAFVGGLMCGQALRSRGHFVFEFMEGQGQLLANMAFFAIGALLLPGAFGVLTIPFAALILLSLFVLRPLAIWLSLPGRPVRERAFYGWFGPRGLATALFALLVLDTYDALQMRTEILAIAAGAVVISAVLHGATAGPVGQVFARHARTGTRTRSATAPDGS